MALLFCQKGSGKIIIEHVTYIGGVTKGAIGADDGVENEPLGGFQRLARYPGVDENDLKTPSAAEKELGWVLEAPTSD